jgi:hypothetical protein
MYERGFCKPVPAAHSAAGPLYTFGGGSTTMRHLVDLGYMQHSELLTSSRGSHDDVMCVLPSDMCVATAHTVHALPTASRFQCTLLTDARVHCACCRYVTVFSWSVLLITGSGGTDGLTSESTYTTSEVVVHGSHDARICTAMPSAR